MSASNSQYLSGSFLNNYNFVHNNLNQIVDKHVPKKLVKKWRSLPWFSRYHKKLHRKKLKLYKKSKSQPRDSHAWIRYTEQQKLFQKSLKVAEQNYVSRHLSDTLHTSPKTFFSFFKWALMLGNLCPKKCKLYGWPTFLIILS